MIEITQNLSVGVVTVFVPKTVETIECEALFLMHPYGAGGSITGSHYCIHTGASSDEPRDNWSRGYYGPNWFRGCYVRFSNGATGWYF